MDGSVAETDAVRWQPLETTSRGKTVSESLPWFKFFPGDFVGSGDVQAMSPTEVGIYVMLLCYSWRVGPIPDDPAKLWRPAKSDPEEFRQAWPAVRACFELADGMLTNARLEKERAAALKRRENSRAAAEAKHAGAGAAAHAGAHRDDPAPEGSPRPSKTRAQNSESRRTETTVRDSANVENSVEYTKGELLEAANSVLGMGVLEREELNRNNSVLTTWEGCGVPARQVWAAIHGLRMMADSAHEDIADWLFPKNPIGLRALRNKRGKVSRRELIDVAADYFAATPPTDGQRTPGARPVTDILKGLGAA